jgi:sodium-dependent dicarboxylate transporter 2/3/5
MLERQAQKGTTLKRWLVLGVAASGALAALWWVPEPQQARALALALVYLVLALSEIVAPFVPTIFLLAATPLVLGSMSSRYQLSSVLAWSADPVIALFAAGFALGLAAERHGVDKAFAALLVRGGGRSRRRLVALVLLAATGASMWMSNVAAAALLLAALAPLLNTTIQPSFQKALLLAVAMGANLGGMATPIGSGPNAIAIAATRTTRSLDFLDWMSFGVPIVLGMLLLAFIALVARFSVSGAYTIDLGEPTPFSGSSRLLLGLFGLAIMAWLSEPWHGATAPTVGLTLMLLLFATGLLGRRDLGDLDWSTLGLIAGGLTLGRLLESAGVLTALSAGLDLTQAPRWLWLGSFVLLSAILAALMSNTATAALLIPLGLLLDHSASTAVIIAVATSFGMPFPISTPPNAMVYGTGKVTVGELLQIGLPLMLIGCVIVTLSGTWFLGLIGID